MQKELINQNNQNTQVQREVGMYLLERRYNGGYSPGIAPYLKRRAHKAARKGAKAEILLALVEEMEDPKAF